MPDTTLNNCRIWYELKGSGDYLLQIGGAGFAHKNFGFVTDDMARITAPTLVMDGDEDILAPLDQGPDGVSNRAIADAIPGAELSAVEGCAHTNLMEQPELSSEIVVNFLTRAAVTTAGTAAA